MHEFSIIDSMLLQIYDLIDTHRLAGVSEIEIEAGELRQVIPEIMEFAFTQSIQGTCLEGARLKINQCEAQARCRSCAETYRPAVADFTCPACRVADADILTGDQIILLSITARQTAPQDITI
ncbi:MAG: hydrogenase maturation nickel metallochaperone HypA [Candidatus Omnitrophica bacterium]|nr:hydrogenase maturation nickel metallochaperone HypA [Candidatus Omnitrophota bacterium]MCB9721998.1 hydrogenase maturation nickel metallochaperone HypA [Candidatus Omnitrophota bacterium]